MACVKLWEGDGRVVMEKLGAEEQVGHADEITEWIDWSLWMHVAMEECS